MKTNFENFIDSINKYLPYTPKTIVEAGGNNCEHTIKFSETFPKSDIHTFECNPHNIEQCKKNILGRDNITLHTHALSDKNGKIKFYPMPENQAASSAFKHITASQECIEVDCSTLDIEADVIWLDAEGSELSILKGAQNLSNTKLIHTEVHFKAAFKRQPLYKDVKKYLNNNGFSLLRFSSLGRNATDAIFVNDSTYRRKTPQIVTEVLYFLKERLIGHTRGLLLRLHLK
jgi:FkbM family methyltransferase